jgi:3-hydroxyisobutyrate dehydrogenase/2-hydroxy-3-oxopropionate reductase
MVEMSTVGPAAIERLAAALPDGVALVDSPVLGSLGEAETGTLQIFAGGSDAAFESVSSLLSALGTPLHVGALGAGASAKLVANSTLFGTIGVLGEALAQVQRKRLAAAVEAGWADRDYSAILAWMLECAED